MAAKHRRTKDKDLDENDSDDSSSGVDVLKRLKTISHVKREQEKKSKRTKKVLNKLCDSEDNSDNEPRKRPMSSLPISRKHSKTRTSSISDDSSSDSSYFEESKRRVKKSMTKRKKKSSSESDLDSGQKKKNNKRPRIASKERTSITSNKGTKNKSMSLEKDDSDSSSSKEFQKPKSKKNKSLRRTSNTGETTFDDYTVVETPSKSDDESIPVEAKEEVKLKHYIIEETEKINRLAEELKNDLECQSSYLIKKKVNFVRDSKFFAHKILRIYDETYKKLKENRTNFADTYKSWINTCSDSRKPVTKKTTKKSYNLSYKSDEDHDVSKNDTRLSDIAPIKPSKRDKSPDETHESDKSKKKFKKSAKQKDSSDESDDDTAIKMNKKSAKKNIGTNESNESDDNNATKEIEKSAKQNSSVDESHESDDAIKKNKKSVKENSDSDEMHESSKSPKSIDNESMKKSTKFSKENSGSDESNESDKSHESDDDQAFEKNKSTKQNSDLDELHESDESHKSENKKEMKKNKKPMNNSECSDKLHESEDDKCTKKNEKTDKKISQQNQRSSNSPTKSIEENSKSSDSDVNEENETVKNDSKSQKKKNLSLSKKTSSKDDSELDSEKNMSNSEENVKSKKSSNLKDKSNALKNNKSISEIACDINKDKEIEETNDSTGQVSECDSEEIFSGDEVRSKRKVNAKTEKSKTDKNEDPSKNSSEQIDVTNSDSSCEDMFESTVSEVANTPVKSPILSSNKSLRKTLLLNSKPTDLDEIIDKSVNDNDEEVNNSDDNASLKSNNKEPSPESLPVNEELSSNEADVEGDAEADADAEDIERKARDKLLYNFDSDDSTDSSNEDKLSSPKSEKSVDSSCSTVIASQNKKNKSAIQKTKNTTKKLKKLPLQTKKRNSISSDSSSDSGEDDNRKKRTKNGGSLSSTKKRRQRAFNVWKNPHYRADKKLQMECQVTLERLSQKVLDKHSRALEKSKKYVDNKKFHSITNLDGLENQKKSKKLAVAELSDGDIVTKTKSRKKKGDKKEVLKDHLDDDNDINNEISDNDLSDKTNGKQLFSDDTFEDIVDEVENNAKDILLNSSSSNEDENGMDVDKTSTSDVNKKDRKKSKKANAKSSKNDDASIEIMDQQSDDEQEDKKEKSKWKQDDLLNFHMTDTESEEEKFLKSQEKKQAKKSKKEENDDPDEESPVKTTTKKSRKPRKKKRILDSDTDAKISSDEGSSSDKASDSEEEKEKEDQKKKSKRRRKKSSSDTSSSEKKPKNKRRRIKKVATDSESDDQDSPNKGRKNIRKVLKDKHVADDTKKAAQDEEERLKRIAERQKLFNEMYDARLAGEAKVDQLVLDVDEETKEELVVVDKELVKRLKPHQAKGIKFMWDACFESLQQIEKSDGSGCIIAHCMGLGKTFQVVTLAHTLLTHEDTKVNTVMVVCPLSTVLNWVNEFKTWLKHVKDGDDIEIYELTKSKKNIERKYMLESWQKTGGVLIIGYEMFRNLTSTGKKMRKAMQESIMRSLVDPGADLVVCDEGHLLKNEDSALSKAMRLVKTRRRVVLTGTPLQNNLKEYHCMVQFVKPNLLGTKKEFLNRFVNPITNGQFDDSTPYDVKLMKKRAHVLHKMLEGSVQRFDYSVLTPFLPPKQEYVIFVRLTEKQIKMYQHYLDNFARRYGQRNGSLFADFQELQRIWTHPYVLRLNAEKVEKANEKKRLEASDSEGSLKDFIDDVSESESIHSLSSSSDTNSDVQCVDSDAEKPIVKTRSTRLNPKEEPEEIVPTPQTAEEAAWWSQFVEEKDFIDLRISTKLILLFGILKESEQIGDKVLVFSQSLYSLTLIEQFLNLIDQESQNDAEAEHLDNHSGTWSLGLDYFRLDGSTSAENRSAWCKIFNNPTNNRARLFLISTRAGGLGINLTAANRVIIFDASWNPSHDVQSIFRIYRFGQKKPCYVYRFLAAGTMEEKIYNRQVTKLSLACRVVDEQQIERHYSNNDLAELYQFESYEGQSQTLALPKDRLLAEIFLKYKDAVWNYHEHDSLLENKEEEELDEEERKQAWLEYEEEKQGKRQMINMGGMGMGMGMGMGNMANSMAFNQMLMNMNSFPELENIKLLIQKDYPNLPPEHLESVARQAVYDMYRYVDQQAVNQILNTTFPGQSMPATNMLGVPGMQTPQQPQQQQPQQFNQQSQLMNMLNQPQMNYPTNHMPVYSGRGRPPKHISVNNQMANIRQMQQLQQMQQQVQQQQQQNQIQPMVINNDEVQVLPNQEVPAPNIDSASNINDIQEE